MKKALVFMLLASLMLSGCQGQVNETPITESSSPSVVESMTEETTSTPETATESFLQPVTEATETEPVTEATEPPQTTQPQITHDREEPTESAAEEPVPETKPTEPPIPETTAPPQTEPVVTEPTETQPPSSQPVTEDEEVSETTAPVETEPPESETNPSTEETTPETEPEPEEEPEPFDIASWVSFAKSYAQSIGLNLDSTAVDCWDNPITAGSHCIYLERDICNRLNRYNADADITDVWIWAVDIGDGCYDLYIGYA